MMGDSIAESERLCLLSVNPNKLHVRRNSDSSMAKSTKIRRLARLLEQDSALVWVINHADELVYLSGACASWLSVDGESLIGRRSKAGTAVSDDPLDLIAASLSPPPGFTSRGTASLRIQPTQNGGYRADTKEVRYVRIGSGDAGFTLGVAGSFEDRRVEPEIQDAVAIRQRLDRWRQRQSGLGSVLLLGESRNARRLRQRIQVACAVRTHVNFVQPSGGGADGLASYIHRRSAADEPLIRIDGPLMDTELLDSALMPVLSRLSDSQTAKASLLWNRLDQTSNPTQQRLHALIEDYQGRLRLFAICETYSLSHRKRVSSSEDLSTDSNSSVGVINGLSDLLETLQINCDQLAQRVEDLQPMVVALLGQQIVSGKVLAERVSRPALDLIVNYPWPNNFLELQEAIRFASQTAIGEAIRVEDLPLSIRSYRPTSPSIKQAIQPLDEQIREYEKQLITQAMEMANQNRSKAARNLGISRSRLIRKLENIGISQSTTETES
ncbi:MAG: helix-turn-helix domain-containing protein [Rubripirellula sp.]